MDHKREMECQQLLRLICEYLDGELDPHLCQQLELHLADCRACRVVVDSTRKTIELYRGNEPFNLPESFRQQLHQVLRRKWDELFFRRAHS